MSNNLLAAFALTLILAVPSLILWILSLSGVLSLSWVWILSPIWIMWGSLFVIGQIVTVGKYFRFQYWK